MDISKNSKIILMIVFAIIMFSSIQSQIDIYIFIGLFIIAPVVIYLFVKKIFPIDK